jgi:hypothetical protein
MAKLKLAVAIARVNGRYGSNLTYQQAYMAGIAGRIPVERNEATGRLEVDESAHLAIAKAFGLIPPKPKAKPAAKVGTNKRPRTRRSRAA